MLRHLLTHRFRASKVPPVDIGFWGIKLLTTAMGEAASDFLVHHYPPVAVVLATGVVFLASLVWQFSRPRYVTLPYWSAVVMVSVFGTMCAAVAHVGFGVAYSLSTASFAGLLVVVFATWRRVEGTLSIHSITSARRELFYWLSVTTTFALGTATGDWTAVTLHWGYLASGLLFTGLFVVPGLAFRLAGANAVAAFWASYVLTRPLGASYADWLGVSPARGGLNWGPGNVALLFSALIALGVVVARRRDRTRETALALG